MYEKTHGAKTNHNYYVSEPFTRGVSHLGPDARPRNARMLNELLDFHKPISRRYYRRTSSTVQQIRLLIFKETWFPYEFAVPVPHLICTLEIT